MTRHARHVVRVVSGRVVSQQVDFGLKQASSDYIHSASDSLATYGAIEMCFD